MQSPLKPQILEVIADFGQLLVVGLILDLLLFEGTEISGTVRLGAVAALLVGVFKSHGWLVLFALQASLFIREPSRPEMIFGLVPWLYVLASTCIVAYAQLGQPFRQCISKWLVLQILLALRIEAPTVSKPLQPQAPRSNWIQFVATQFFVWMMVTLVAMMALLRLPISSTSRSEWLRNAIKNDFTVWPGATLLVLSLLLVIVFMEAGWRQLTVAQASLYLRSSFVLEHYGDLRMIVVRRLKMSKNKVSAGVPQKLLVARDADAVPKL